MRGLSVARAAAPTLRVPRAALALVGLTLAALVLGLAFGRGGNANAEVREVFFTIRGYRTAAAFLSGAALAVGGVITQGLFRNPLATPSVLGTGAGATLGGQLALVLAVVTFESQVPAGLAREMVIALGCVLGAVASLGIVLFAMSSRASSLALILAGYALMSLFSAVGSLLTSAFQSSWQLARAMTELSGGSVAGAGPRHVVLGLVLIVGGALPAWSLSPTLDLLLSGEDEARSLGVSVRGTRFWAVVWASVLTAGAVAIGGNVLFVGMIVPHVLRRYVGERHHTLMPASFVAGGGVLVLCDVVCRLVPTPGEISLAVVTSILGAPIFLWTLREVYAEARHA